MDSSGPPADPDQRERAEVVEGLVCGLREERGVRVPLQTSWFDEPFAGLGLDSLDLVELMLRLEESLGVSLPPNLLAVTETPRDVMTALGAAPPRRLPAGPRPEPATTPGVALGPAAGDTLLEVLAWHVERQPGREHLRVLGADGVEARISYAALVEAAARTAAGLAERGVGRGDRVAIMLPTGREYFETFLGVLAAGAVPVLIYPPARRSQLADHLRRQAGILGNCGAVSLVTVAEALPLGRVLRSELPGLREVVEASALPVTGTGAGFRARPEDVAFLQYTSGSTGSPKGVVLTHANLLANIGAMAEASGVGPSDVFVSWLPLYHDMGLIGAWFGSLVVGMPLVVMSPLLFLSRPVRWLRAIQDHGGTVSAGPDFAYGLCAARVRDDELEGLDLSSWRLAFNGAEPVHPDTLDAFARRFGPCGFRREALMPVYGLAESSVGLTFPPPGRGPLVDRVRLADLGQGRAVPASPDDTTALRFVACGSPLPGHEVMIAGPAGGSLADRQEGRILFRGPSATGGYFDSPEANRTLFAGSWLDTGDLGYLADGDLYVTGRVKDMIVRAGRNVHPEELESAVGPLDGVRTGCVAAFAVPDPDRVGERLVVVAETRLVGPEARESLRDRIARACAEVVGVAPDDVVLAEPGTVLKTSSGKVRRAATRERLQGAGHAPERIRRGVTARLAAGLAGVRARATAGRGLHLLWRAWVAVVVVVVVLTAVPLLAVLPGLGQRRRLARWVARTAAAVTGIGVTAEGIERLPAGSAVVVANHASWVDALALAAVLPPRFTFVAGEVFATQRLAGFVLGRLGTRYVERHDPVRAATDEVALLDAVRSGESLVMFPEGGLDTEPGVRRFHLGAFVVAADGGVPVVPVVLRGTRTILPPGGWRTSRGSAHVVVGEPLTPRGTGWTAAVALEHAARSAILRRCGEPDRAD